MYKIADNVHKFSVINPVCYISKCEVYPIRCKILIPSLGKHPFSQVLACFFANSKRPHQEDGTCSNIWPPAGAKDYFYDAPFMETQEEANKKKTTDKLGCKVLSLK